MASKFSQIADGSFFKAGGVSYRKLDALYYEDPVARIEYVWSPLFDQTVEPQVATEPVTGSADTTSKFLVDPSSRLMRPNPNYKESNKWFDLFYASGYFGENATEEEIVNGALDALRVVDSLEGLTEAFDDHDTMVDILTVLYIDSLGLGKGVAAEEVEEVNAPRDLNRELETRLANCAALKTRDHQEKSAPKKKKKTKGAATKSASKRIPDAKKPSKNSKKKVTPKKKPTKAGKKK